MNNSLNMKNVRHFTGLLSLLLTIAMFSQSSMADIVIVVNEDSPLTSLSSKEAKRIFLGVTKKLPNGKSIKIADVTNDKEMMAEFYMTVTNKSVSEIKSRWAGLAFSGKAVPPARLKSQGDVKIWLKINESGISYIDSKNMEKGIRVVYTLPK